MLAVRGRAARQGDMACVPGPRYGGRHCWRAAEPRNRRNAGGVRAPSPHVGKQWTVVREQLGPLHVA